jgi:hypothetical protein
MAEERKERIDRELIELLNELRVALPGVQVLFAFLLILPFQQGFADVNDLERTVYFLGLAATAIASAIFIAPASYHRINHRRGVDEKEEMLLTSSRLAIIGTLFLAIGIACCMFVVADVLFGTSAAIATALATVAVFGSLWYALPLLARRRGGEDDSGKSRR